MGPPTEPPPLCSSPLTRSLVLVLSLSVATRSSSLFVILPFFFFFFFFFYPISPFLLFIRAFLFLSSAASFLFSLLFFFFRFFFTQSKKKIKNLFSKRKDALPVTGRESSDRLFRGERSGRLTWKGERRGGFWWIVCESASVYPHLQIPWCLLSAFRPIFLHIVGNLSILAHGIIHSWPI